MIVYIHGASATAESFTHIRQFVKKKYKQEPDILLEYNSNNGFVNNLAMMKEKLKGVDKLFFISHSLGGIYSLYLADFYKEKTIGGISLSTPYGGSKEADFAKYFIPFSKLMKDIGTMRGPLFESRYIPAPKNWTNIVTTAGVSPWIHDQNDGVVTLESMKFRNDFELIEVNLNHYEVVISDKVVKIILDKISKVLK
mgnify:FL=1